ncbi:MAG: Nif3-like dinuclear metal center hexameric protein [Blastocatellia bacterium]|nr:Nif3-like dinuclear metal center hexameric protein [Blastocatellia bacterium]
MIARNKSIVRRLAIIFASVILLNLHASTQENHLTAQQVIDRIKKNVGVPWREQTVDTFKAGNPDARVTGVATTMMATFDVLQRAAAAGKNLIITHEPTFYDHLDKTDDLEKENDAVLAAKQAFIKEHNLVIWRFHDHWHMRKPDGIQTGMIRALGWEKFQTSDNSHVFVIPETTLGNLVADIKTRLGIRAMRVIGDPDMKLTKVALAPGYPGFPRQRQTLQRDDVEALLTGEAREWETIEYGDDAVAAGKRKALIVLGHIPSEQAGMEECARWLKNFITEVPVEFIPTKEPFWTPK